MCVVDGGWCLGKRLYGVLLGFLVVSGLLACGFDCIDGLVALARCCVICLGWGWLNFGGLVICFSCCGLFSLLLLIVV